MSSSEARVAPFAFGEAEARLAALAWMRRRWLASPVLARRAREDAIESAWIPFWLIDAQAVAHWEGPGLRGIVEMDFGAVPVCAEPHADHLLMEELEPWPASALRAREPADDHAHAIVVAELAADEALTLAERRMERDLTATARRSQPATVRERVRMLTTEFPRESSERVLLPVWRFEGMRLGRRWRVAINGVTAKTAGRRVA